MWPMSFTEIYEESWPIRRRQMLQLLLINFYNKTCLYNLYSQFKGGDRITLVLLKVDKDKELNQKEEEEEKANHLQQGIWLKPRLTNKNGCCRWGLNV